MLDRGAYAGNFLVSLESLKKYANGYQATFSIGNPSSATYDGIKLRLKWGEANSLSASTLKSEEVEINKKLLPGKWNKVTVVLSPATPQETGIIYLSIDAHSVILATDPIHATTS